MMVRVWNDNVHPFTQEIAGTTYKIPAKECIELEEDEAKTLVKRFSPIRLGGDDRPLPETYKMLRIDSSDLEKAKNFTQNRHKAGSYVCQACGYVAANKWELDGHTSDQHSEQWEDSDEARASINEAKATRKKRAAAGA